MTGEAVLDSALVPKNRPTAERFGRSFLARAAAVGLLTLGASLAAESYNAPPAHASTTFSNDYPDMDATDCSATYGIYSWCKTGGPSAHGSNRGFDYRNCTDGAAYWAKTYTSVIIPGSWGNANTWNTRAADAGYSVYAGTTNMVEPGDLAQDSTGDFGHVGLVTDVVKDGTGNVTSITVAELNKNAAGGYSHDTYTAKNAANNFTRNAAGKYWDHFIDVNGAGKGLNNEVIGTGGTGGGSGTPGAGTQMILDSTGKVWARNTPGYYGAGGWTPESGTGEKAIAAGGNGLQMMIDGNGNVWSQTSIGSSWTQETNGGGIQAIAAGANGQQMLLDSIGQVWAIPTPTYYGSGGWTRETGSGEKAIAMGDNGLQMVLDGSGQVWTQTSIGTGWTQETSGGITAISAGDNGLQMILDSVGHVWARTSPGYYANGGWTQETPSGEKAIAAGNGGLQMIMDGSGQVWAKNTVANGGWTQETGTEQTKIAAGDNSQQMIMDGSGQIWEQNNIAYNTWTQETPNGEVAMAVGS